MLPDSFAASAYVFAYFCVAFHFGVLTLQRDKAFLTQKGGRYAAPLTERPGALHEFSIIVIVLCLSDCPCKQSLVIDIAYIDHVE